MWEVAAPAAAAAKSLVSDGYLQRRVAACIQTSLCNPPTKHAAGTSLGVTGYAASPSTQQVSSGPGARRKH